MRARSTPVDASPARSKRIRSVPCNDGERSTSHEHHQRADVTGLPSRPTVDHVEIEVGEAIGAQRRREPFETMPQASRITK